MTALDGTRREQGSSAPGLLRADLGGPTALIHGRTLSAVSRAVDDVKVQEVSAEEGPALLDRAARHYLDMSGDEFAVAWEASPFDDDPGRPEVMAVAMLPPFGR